MSLFLWVGCGIPLHISLGVVSVVRGLRISLAGRPWSRAAYFSGAAANFSISPGLLFLWVVHISPTGCHPRAASLRWSTMGTRFIAAACLVATLSACDAPRDPAPDAAALSAERVAMLERATRDGFQSRPALLCAAERASAATVESTYLARINGRGDLLSDAQRDAAARDTVAALESCGIGAEMIAAELDKGDEFGQAFALAMLQAGRQGRQLVDQVTPDAAARSTITATR